MERLHVELDGLSIGSCRTTQEDPECPSSGAHSRLSLLSPAGDASGLPGSMMAPGAACVGVGLARPSGAAPEQCPAADHEGHGAAMTICYDFTKGLCSRGDKCKFSHDIATIVHFNSKEKGICFDFLRPSGCHRGLLCRFSHDLASIQQQCAGQSAGPEGACRATKAICFDFVRGVCERGSECRYSHDLSVIARTGRGGPQSLKAHEVCYDFLRGRCERGTACKYSHSTALLGAPAPGLMAPRGPQSPYPHHHLPYDASHMLVPGLAPHPGMAAAAMAGHSHSGPPSLLSSCGSGQGLGPHAQAFAAPRMLHPEALHHDCHEPCGEAGGWQGHAHHAHEQQELHGHHGLPLQGHNRSAVMRHLALLQQQNQMAAAAASAYGHAYPPPPPPPLHHAPHWQQQQQPKLGSSAAAVQPPPPPNAPQLRAPQQQPQQQPQPQQPQQQQQDSSKAPGGPVLALRDVSNHAGTRSAHEAGAAALGGAADGKGRASEGGGAGEKAGLLAGGRPLPGSARAGPQQQENDCTVFTHSIAGAGGNAAKGGRTQQQQQQAWGGAGKGGAPSVVPQDIGAVLADLRDQPHALAAVLADLAAAAQAQASGAAYGARLQPARSAPQHHALPQGSDDLLAVRDQHPLRPFASGDDGLGPRGGMLGGRDQDQGSYAGGPGGGGGSAGAAKGGPGGTGLSPDLLPLLQEIWASK